MRVLIIGCGYLGRRAAKLWLDRGDQVTALTRSSSRTKELAALGIRPVIGDVTDAASLSGLPDADVCLYAVGFDRAGGQDKRAVYVDGLRAALEAVSQRVPRLIHISSTSVYGQNSGETVTESSPAQSVEESGCICRDAEDVVNEFAATRFAGGAVVLRLSGIYGPGRLIGRLDQLRARQPFTGNPDAWLNLIHVDDAARAARMLGDRTDLRGTWLLSDERPLSRKEFYSLLVDLVGAPAPVFVPDGEAAFNKRCDSSTFRAALGLKLDYPTAAKGLRHALEGQI